MSTSRKKRIKKAPRFYKSMYIYFTRSLNDITLPKIVSMNIISFNHYLVFSFCFWCYNFIPSYSSTHCACLFHEYIFILFILIKLIKTFHYTFFERDIWITYFLNQAVLISFRAVPIQYLNYQNINPIQYFKIVFLLLSL